VEQPQWLDDPRFARNPLRVKNADALQEMIEAIFTTRTTAHWVEKLDAAGVPGGPVYTYEQTMSDPQVQHRRMVYDIEHPVIGPMKTLGLPVKSTGELTQIRKPAPLHGQHTEEVLRTLGYSDKQVQGLLAEGVVKATRLPA
jgi:crotonobetainyl-CoA:carnitine CoA-transferase CaiB-like acyl-CoA transferase